MKNISPELLALLFPANGIPINLFVADLYRFDLVTGGSLFYTDGDQDIVFDGNTYVSGQLNGGPFFNRTANRARAHFKIGVEVDSVSFDVIPYLAQVEGTTFQNACIVGVFDGGMLTISRAFMPTYGDVSAGVIQWFYGIMGEINPCRNIVPFNAYTLNDKLNQQMPRNIAQAGCLNTLYDGACTLIKASFGVSGSVVSGSSASQVNAVIGNPTGYFDLGVLEFTSGDNDGLSRTVKTWINGSPGTVAFIDPFPNNPEAGDTFTIYPGCDKTKATCSVKFSNLANFRGMPFIPPAETGI